ncbi:uncharacterized protein DS421_5g158790 [Arachis hypogaea]|nr:uncharacterized protein DS421_5g158790 [Arachis hypogaea]
MSAPEKEGVDAVPAPFPSCREQREREEIREERKRSRATTRIADAPLPPTVAITEPETGRREREEEPFAIASTTTPFFHRECHHARH